MANHNADSAKKEGCLKGAINRFSNDPLFSEIVCNSAGAVLNLVLAALNGYSGYANHNPWSQSMAFYFLVLGLMTIYVTLCIGKPENRSARMVMKQCGVCIMILGVAIASFMYLYVIGHEIMQLSAGTVWALTIFTLVLAFLSIYNTYQYRNSDLVRHAFQRVSLATTVGSLVLLEIQLLGTFGQDLNPTFVTAIETVTTLIAVAVLIIFGRSLLVRADEVVDVPMKERG